LRLGVGALLGGGGGGSGMVVRGGPDITGTRWLRGPEGWSY